MQVKEGNVRLVDEALGGGPVYDIGIYCINAARYLFRDEPEEVFAFSATGESARFKDSDEMTAAVLRFPNNRLATFTCSFGAADTSMYRIVGTEGDLRVEPAYEYAGRVGSSSDNRWKNTESEHSRNGINLRRRLNIFQDCILKNKKPEPGGEEGLIDVQIIEGILESARTGRPVSIEKRNKESRPDQDQEIQKPPIEEPELVNAESASRD